MKIIIPMAGLGTRFQKVADTNPEYSKPKPFILVRGVPMVRWATGSLPFVEHQDKTEQQNLEEIKARPQDLIFIILKDHDDKHSIKDGLQKVYGPTIKVIILDKVTRGAAETAYKAKEFIDPEEEILITDSDHFFDGIHLMNVISTKHAQTAGVIPVFQARNEGIPKWSYSLIEPNSRFIVRVAEKDRELMEQGAHANIGAYYFSKGKYFLDEVEEVIKNNIMFGDVGKQEFYVAPIYQRLIDKGMKIEAAIIPEVWGLGTPEDLEYFLRYNTKEQP